MGEMHVVYAPNSLLHTQLNKLVPPSDRAVRGAPAGPAGHGLR